MELVTWTGKHKGWLYAGWKDIRRRDGGLCIIKSTNLLREKKLPPLELFVLCELERETEKVQKELKLGRRKEWKMKERVKIKHFSEWGGANWAWMGGKRERQREQAITHENRENIRPYNSCFQ